MIYGNVIDLSAANTGRVDLARARDEQGVTACYFRGTLGRVTLASDTDGRVHEYANKARAAGLPFGLYALAYARHGQPQDADKQADDAIALALSLNAELIAAPDWEHEKGDERVTEIEFYDAINLWVDRAERCQLGRAPLLYTGPGWWSQSKLRTRATALARCPLWSSDFEASRPIGQPLATPPWGRAAMHQFAGGPTPTGRAGACAGIDGYVDRSTLLVPLDALRW